MRWFMTPEQARAFRLMQKFNPRPPISLLNVTMWFGPTALCVIIIVGWIYG